MAAEGTLGEMRAAPPPPPPPPSPVGDARAWTKPAAADGVVVPPAPGTAFASAASTERGVTLPLRGLLRAGTGPRAGVPLRLAGPDDDDDDDDDDPPPPDAAAAARRPASVAADDDDPRFSASLRDPPPPFSPPLSPSSPISKTGWSSGMGMGAATGDGRAATCGREAAAPRGDRPPTSCGGGPPDEDDDDDDPAPAGGVTVTGEAWRLAAPSSRYGSSRAGLGALDVAADGRPLERAETKDSSGDGFGAAGALLDMGSPW